MNLKNLWSENFSTKAVVLVALVSLAIGLGISGSLDWLAPTRANLMGEAATPEVRGGLPDFVSLAKRMKPLVVNISTTAVSEGRGGGGQDFGSPFGEEDPFNDFWRRFFGGPGGPGGPGSRGPQRQRSSGLSSIATAPFLLIITLSKMPKRSSSSCPTTASMRPRWWAVTPRPTSP